MALPESATFSNTAQTRLVLWRYTKKLHFLVITVEINHISSVYQHELLMFHMMSHVLMVVLFVKQNIFKLHSSKITPVRQKQAMCETIIWCFLLCLYNRHFLALEVLYQWNCSNKGAVRWFPLINQAEPNRKSSSKHEM